MVKADGSHIAGTDYASRTIEGCWRGTAFASEKTQQKGSDCDGYDSGRKRVHFRIYRRSPSGLVYSVVLRHRVIPLAGLHLIVIALGADLDLAIGAVLFIVGG